MTQRCLVAGGALSLVALTLAACQSDAQQAPMGTAPGLASACIEDEAEALAGKARIGDAEAQQATGATIVRQIRPGQGVTMDYRPERVTIETNSKTGRIIRAYCG